MSSSSHFRIVIAALALVWNLYGQKAAAVTVAVGPTTCEPSRAHYATIQAAVSAVPAGSTVVVCPGSYPEQVLITQPLTLKGVTDGTGDAAVITVPAGGLVLNASAPVAFGGPVSGQLVVQNSVSVEVSDITVDGAGSGCVTGALRQAGIVVSGAGASDVGASSIKIDNVTVRNQHGCAEGEGIIADSSFLTIVNNQIHDIDITGIVVGAGTVNIHSNNMQTVSNGVSVNATNNTVITANTVAGAGQAGIIVQDNSAGTTVANNVVLASPAAIGIGLLASATNTMVTGNTVSNCIFGIMLGAVGNNVVQSNNLSQLGSDGVLDEFSLGGNIVTKNIVNEAAFGILTDSTGASDTLTPNTFYNAVVTLDPSPLVMEAVKY